MGRVAHQLMWEGALRAKYNIPPGVPVEFEYVGTGAGGGKMMYPIGIKGYGPASETALKTIEESERVAAYQKYHEELKQQVKSATGEYREPTYSEFKGQEFLLPRAGGVQYVSTPAGVMEEKQYLQSISPPVAPSPKMFTPLTTPTMQERISGGREYFTQVSRGITPLTPTEQALGMSIAPPKAPALTTFGIGFGEKWVSTKGKVEKVIKEASMFFYPRYRTGQLTDKEISRIKETTPLIFEPYRISKASRLAYESRGLRLESIGSAIEVSRARGIEPIELIEEYQKEYYIYEQGTKGEVTALTKPFGIIPFRETATGLGIKARQFTYKTMPEISTKEFTQTALGLSEFYYGKKISGKLKPFTEYSVGTISGYYGELRERPGKFLATAGITAAAIPALKLIGGLGTAISPTATKIMGVGGGAILTGTYVWGIGKRIYIAKTPTEKGEVTGGILAGEVTPMLLGGYAALEIAPRISGQVKGLFYRARGLPEYKFIPEAFEVEVLSKGKQFPSAPPSKHLQIFKEQKYALPSVTKLEGYTGKGEIVYPSKYKSLEFSVPKGAWHVGEFKGGVISVGERPTEWKGLFVSPQPSLYFLRAGAESYSPYSLNLFPEYGGKAGALWLEPLKFKELPRQWRGKATQFAEVAAKKGTAYVLGQKAEIEAGIPVGTQVQKISTVGFFKYKGRAVPVISMKVVGEGLPVKTNLPALGAISYSYRGVPSRLPLTTPLSYALTPKSLVSPSYKYYKSVLPSAVSYKGYGISYAPKSYISYTPYKPYAYKPYKPYISKSYLPYESYTPKPYVPYRPYSYKPYKPYKPYIPKIPPYYPISKKPPIPPFGKLFKLPSMGERVKPTRIKYRQPHRYLPSLTASVLNIKGALPYSRKYGVVPIGIRGLPSLFRKIKGKGRKRKYNIV